MTLSTSERAVLGLIMFTFSYAVAQAFILIGLAMWLTGAWWMLRWVLNQFSDNFNDKGK